MWPHYLSKQRTVHSFLFSARFHIRCHWKEGFSQFKKKKIKFFCDTDKPKDIWLILEPNLVFLKAELDRAHGEPVPTESHPRQT